MIDISNEVDEAINKAIDEVAPTIVKIIKSEYSHYPASLGKADVNTVKKIAKEEIELVFNAIGQRALILEYGRGSSMDRDNPALDEYMRSDVFNRNRIGLEIRTRPKGVYYDLDGNPHVSHTNVNRDLEKTDNSKYAPLKPEHIVREAIKQNLKKIMETVSDYVIRTVPLYKLFTGTEVNIRL